MTDILIQYANSTDRTEAVQIQNKIEELSSLTVNTKNTSTVDFSNYYGVIVVGGHNTNPVYEEIGKATDWQIPIDIPFGRTYNEVITDIYEYENTVVQGIAGYLESDTPNAVDNYTGADEVSNYDIFFGSTIDEFIQQVQSKAPGEDREEVNDPTLPGDSEPVTDPDADPNEETEDKIYEHTAKINFWNIGQAVFSSGTFSIEVSDSLKVVNEEGTGIWDQKNATLELGPNDVDTVYFNGKITDFEAEKDVMIEINGETFRYDADKDMITGGPEDVWTGNKSLDTIAESEMDPDLRDEKEQQDKQESQTTEEDILEALKNPTESVDNALKTSMVVLILVIFLRVTGVAENLSG